MDRPIEAKRWTARNLGLYGGGVAVVCVLGFLILESPRGSTIRVDPERVTIATIREGDFHEFMDPDRQEAFRRVLYIKIADADVKGTLEFLEDTFSRIDPSHPFGYWFLDDILDRQYASERRQMQLIGVFAGVCILISSMGLFGLSAFTTAQRTKEIGARKILGASTSRIIFIRFKDVVGLILAALVVSCVVSYYVISNWLAGFAYKEGIGLTAFLVAGAFCLGIAFFTVALQSYRTARASPALALRYEG